jgi:hypothetical protein
LFSMFCLLYVLSMVTLALDLLNFALEVEVSTNNSILEIIIIQMLIGALSPQLQNGSQSMIYRVYIVQTVANGSCDFIAQSNLVCLNHRAYPSHPIYSPKSSKIFRCWIVWGKDTRVVIIPLFLAIAYIGQ